MASMRSSAATWLGVAIRCSLAGNILVFAVCQLRRPQPTRTPQAGELVPAQTRSELDSIQRRLAAGQDAWMQTLFPEGQLFSHSFYGFTLVNLAMENPGDREFRRHALAELERLIPLTQSLQDRRPYDASSQLTPRGGIILAGHLSRLRAGYLLLGGDSPRIAADFHTDCRALHKAFLRSTTANLESYPGRIWPVDNLMALDALRIHDNLYQTAYGDAVDRWTRFMSSKRDPATGLLPSQIDAAGNVLEGPRGCAMSWTLAMLPSLAPELAREQYDRYRAWFGHSLGLAGFREYPPGVDGPSDADSGPIVGGLGMAASGLGIAAARANADSETQAALEASYRRLHLPGWLLLPDELALWGQTQTVWARPAEPAARSDRNVWPAVSVLLLTALAAEAALRILSRRARRRPA